jgi:hypothetical protein
MTMPQEHREALFRLAEAWIMVAQEAEREARSEDADVRPRTGVPGRHHHADR